MSGVVRPGTQSGRPGSALERLRTSRGATGQSARAIRLGTAAMLTQKDGNVKHTFTGQKWLNLMFKGPFIQVSRLNLSKYAKNKSLNKPLFEYLFYHEGDVRNAMELAVLATQACEFKVGNWGFLFKSVCITCSTQT